MGDHLAAAAIGAGCEELRDLFGRSAFNRYYYSAFLAIREVLKTIDSDWAKPAHKDVPNLIKVTVLKRLKNQIGKATKAGQISESEGKRLYRQAATAACEIANLLQYACEVRRLADYEPESRVQFNGNSISLGNQSLESAKGWIGRARTQAKAILKVYAELGLISY